MIDKTRLDDVMTQSREVYEATLARDGVIAATIYQLALAQLLAQASAAALHRMAGRAVPESVDYHAAMDGAVTVEVLLLRESTRLVARLAPSDAPISPQHTDRLVDLAATSFEKLRGVALP